MFVFLIINIYVYNKCTFCKYISVEGSVAHLGKIGSGIVDKKMNGLMDGV